MAKFYFDESVADKVSSGLRDTENNIQSIRRNLNQAITQLEMCDGFNIVSSMNAVDSEMKIMDGISGKADKGVLVMRAAFATVQKYEKLADGVKYSNYVEQYVAENILPNGKFNNVFSEYYGMTSDYIDRYCYNFLTVVASIKEAFEKTFTDGSYENYLIKNTIKDIISSSSGDIQFSNPLSDITEGKKNVDNFIGILDKNYKKGPFSEGKLSELIDKVNYSEEIFNILAKDYNKDMEYLNAIERSLIASGYDNKMVDAAMTSVRADYSNKFVEVATSMLHKGEEEFLKIVAKGNPISSAVMKSLEIMELADVTANEKMQFSVITNYEHDIQNAYESLGRKIHSGEYTEQDVADFEIMFKINKNMNIKKYTLASEFVIGQDYLDCQQALQYYENLEM